MTSSTSILGNISEVALLLLCSTVCVLSADISAGQLALFREFSSPLRDSLHTEDVVFGC